MVAILKHVRTADWDRERLNMSLNTPANVIHRRYPEHIPWYVQDCDQNNIEVWILIGQTSIPQHGYFLFEFLPIGREDQNGVVIRFAERRGEEGLVGIPEVGVAVVDCFGNASPTYSQCVDRTLVVFSSNLLLKSPDTINAASGYVVSSLQKIQCSSLKAVKVTAWGGM